MEAPRSSVTGRFRSVCGVCRAPKRRCVRDGRNFSQGRTDDACWDWVEVRNGNGGDLRIGGMRRSGARRIDQRWPRRGDVHHIRRHAGRMPRQPEWRRLQSLHEQGSRLPERRSCDRLARGRYLLLCHPRSRQSRCGLVGYGAGQLERSRAQPNEPTHVPGGERRDRRQFAVSDARQRRITQRPLHHPGDSFCRYAEPGWRLHPRRMHRGRDQPARLQVRRVQGRTQEGMPQGRKGQRPQERGHKDMYEKESDGWEECKNDSDGKDGHDGHGDHSSK